MTRHDFALGLLTTMLTVNRDRPRPARIAFVASLVILHVAREPDRWHPATEIIRLLNLHSGSLATILYPAVQESYLRRRQAGDGRTFEYQISENGKALAVRLLNPDPVALATA